jgi:hypothetical protein
MAPFRHDGGRKDHDNLAELVEPVAIGCRECIAVLFWNSRGGTVRLSLDWWAVIAAAVAVVLIKAGVISSIPW